MSQTVLESPAEDAVKDTDDEGLTELEKIDPERVDGVGTPANGFPTLMLKGITGDDGEEAAKSDPPEDDGDNEDDQDADDGEGPAEKSGPLAGDAVEDAAWDYLKNAGPAEQDAYKAAVTEWRAREPVWKGRGDGTEYLQLRAKWQTWDAEGDEHGLKGTEDGARTWLAEYALRDDAVKTVADAETATLGDVEKKDYSAEQRRSLASQGKALSDGSYPIADAQDLKNAATLAQSGHGNVAGAKRLISRRAKELGVSNPLTSDSKKDAAPAKKCGTCNGSGKIRDGKMTCPDCKGKNATDDSKKESGVREDMVKAWNAIAERYQISAEDAAALVEAMEKASRPLPSDVKPAGAHREPDGSSTVERLEPQAGLPTDRDATKDKVPASVMGKEAPYAVRRMHDATCAAYDAGDVLAEYPALKSLTEALDPALLAGSVTGAEGIVKAIEGLQAMDPAAVADGRALVHKAFTDMYPSAHCSPSAPPQPGSFHRPYLSAGHSAEHASGGASVPPSSHVPDPGQFHRGYLSAGHAAPSPADSGASRPVVTGASRANYAAASKAFAEQSLKAIHDHLVTSYQEVCPMATGPGTPPDLGARSVPTPTTPTVPGGIDAVKAAKLKSGKKVARQMAAEVAKALAAQGALTDPETVKALIDAQLAPIREGYEQKISGLEKTVEELGAQPDPALAPVRGQMARPTTGTATPVEKRNLIDEAREREAAAIAKQAQDHADYIEYVRKAATSTNPQVRESALAVLGQIGADAAAKPA